MERWGVGGAVPELKCAYTWNPRCPLGHRRFESTFPGLFTAPLLLLPVPVTEIQDGAPVPRVAAGWWGGRRRPRPAISRPGVQPQLPSLRTAPVADRRVPISPRSRSEERSRRQLNALVFPGQVAVPAVATRPLGGRLPG
ncbi:hypothetical protein NDU88_001556 [Pleurodeles waltl]|uniref:Uncharacterized protein n=1 Tax=Pleurodeles waltl TaxID=8319 RepID=A0AAV7NJE8_PLEWA|nr:hypothetical protein NDU88_001556 [Pleurodeles waltl]